MQPIIADFEALQGMKVRDLLLPGGRWNAERLETLFGQQIV